MYVLGIESSCDETAASVVFDRTGVLSNVIYSQAELHGKFGGVVPEIASRNHLLKIIPVIEQALDDASITLRQLDCIAVTRGPGLVGALLIGLQTAKTIAWALNIPIVFVNHVEAHIHAIFLGNNKKPDFPYLGLAVSGGHTSLYIVKAPDDMECVAYTIDDAAGEAFDKSAKLLNMPYPGGIKIEKLAQNGNGSAIAFPRPKVKRDPLLFSFSGLKTAVRYFIENNRERLQTDKQFKADVCASIQESITDVLCDRTFKAAQKYRINQIVVAGGVAANIRLRKKMVETGKKIGKEVFLTPLEFCTDNAAMVAGMGSYLFKKDSGVQNFLSIDTFTKILM